MAVLEFVAPPVLRNTDLDVIGRIERRGTGLVAIPLVQADILSITMRVFSGSVQVGATMTLDKTVVIFDTPESGPIWTKPLPANFLTPLPRSYVETAGTYKILIDVMLQSGKVAHGVFRLSTRPLPGDV